MALKTLYDKIQKGKEYDVLAEITTESLINDDIRDIFLEDLEDDNPELSLDDEDEDLDGYIDSIPETDILESTLYVNNAYGEPKKIEYDTFIENYVPETIINDKKK